MGSQLQTGQPHRRRRPGRVLFSRTSSGLRLLVDYGEEAGRKEELIFFPSINPCRSADVESVIGRQIVLESIEEHHFGPLVDGKTIVDTELMVRRMNNDIGPIFLFFHSSDIRMHLDLWCSPSQAKSTYRRANAGYVPALLNAYLGILLI